MNDRFAAAWQLLPLYLSDHVLLSVAVYVCYAYAPMITARVRPQTAHGILRVVAFVLMCIGVQITWNGVHALLTTVFPNATH